VRIYDTDGCSVMDGEPVGLERDLELERRKNRDHQEQLRERDKEYSKLKV
jgi:E3 ubiquitin-protein ligase CCNP1IP1